MTRLVTFWLWLIWVTLLGPQELSFNFHQFADVAVFVVSVSELVVVHGIKHLVNAHIFIIYLLEEQFDTVVHISVNLFDFISLF